MHTSYVHTYLLPPEDFSARHDGVVGVERCVPHQALVHDHLKWRAEAGRGRGRGDGLTLSAKQKRSTSYTTTYRKVFLSAHSSASIVPVCSTSEAAKTSRASSTEEQKNRAHDDYLQNHEARAPCSRTPAAIKRTTQEQPPILIL